MDKCGALRVVVVCGLLFGLPGVQAQDSIQPGSTSYVYDGQGRVIEVLYENGKGQIYTYDAAGNRVTSFSGTPVICNFDSTSAQMSVTEGGSVTLTVDRSGANVLSKVQYKTVDGTAVAGINYTAASGIISFNAGQTTQTITIGTLHDSVYDGPLGFSVELLPVSTNTALAMSAAQVTINDVDPAPVFSISSNASVVEGNPSTLTVTRSNPTSLTQTIGYATADNSAIAGVDYLTTIGTLSFAPSDTSHTFTVPTLYRELYEPNRNFSVTLGNPSSGLIGSGTINPIVKDGDPPTSFAINSPASVTEGQPLTFTVTTSGGAAGVPISLHYAAASGTAVSGTDFSAASGTLTFQPTDTAHTITVQTLWAHADTTARTFTVTLSAGGITFGTPVGTGTIQATAVPPAPINLSPAHQTVTPQNRSFNLSWTMPPGTPANYDAQYYYQVWLASSSSTAGAPVQAMSFQGTTPPAVQDTDYAYYVVACTDAAGTHCGAASNQVIVEFDPTSGN